VIPVPFTVIGGFLGAGKTTLLNRLLTQSSGLRYAVLVNDFGRLEIDAALVRSRNSETISLVNGCMCCSIADGFTRALTDVLVRLDDFDHIVVEASGVAQPSRIIDIAKLEPELHANGVVVMVDSALVREHGSDAYVGDVVIDQLKGADLLVVNKASSLSAEGLAVVSRWLAEISGGTPMVECDYADVSLELVLGESCARSDVTRPKSCVSRERLSDKFAVESAFRTISLESTVCLDRSEFLAAAASLPSSVIRGKGLVRFETTPDELWLWQKVGLATTLSAVEESAAAGSRLVLIGTPEFAGCEGLELAELFHDCDN
jgi:G3E family GTPase